MYNSEYRRVARCVPLDGKRGPGLRSNLVKSVLTQFFQGQTPGKIGGKTCPFREIPVRPLPINVSGNHDWTLHSVGEI